MDNEVMAYINKHFEDAGCQSAKHYLEIANFTKGFKRLCIFIGLVVLIFAFTQNIPDGFSKALFQSILGSVLITYILAVIINGTYYAHKYYNLCNTEYPAKGKPLDPEIICRFMSKHITLPEYSNWNYGYDKNERCGFVEYKFKGKSEKQIIILHPEKDRFEIQIGRNYTITNLFGTFTLRQVKYVADLTAAKAIIVLAMTCYLVRAE